MTEVEFRNRRRQKSLTKGYFELNAVELEASYQTMLQTLSRERLEGKADSSTQDGIFKNRLKLLRLHYTAGDPIESLRPLYADALHWFEEWHKAYRTYIAHLAAENGDDLRTDGTPARFEDLFHFQLTLDTVSLGILLGEGDAVRRVASWLSRYRATDMLMEYLLETVVPGPQDIETFFHEQPYGALVDAIYTADSPEESAAFVRQYLQGWYKSFEGVPWHNGHLVQTEAYSNYEGYWAFDAAAVCVLRGIDDSSFRDHIAYPKDLADWARAHRIGDLVKRTAPTQGTDLRCEAASCVHAQAFGLHRLRTVPGVASMLAISCRTCSPTTVPPSGSGISIKAELRMTI